MIQYIISNMQHRQVAAGIRTVFGLLLTVLTTVGASASDNRAPEVPDDIAVGDGYKVHFHGLGVGVQIYTWNGSSWGPATPRATLYDDEGNVVATHFAGPRWQSNSGSLVKGIVVPPTATVDTNAIPWVRLSAASEGGNGIFADIKFIQRVNTVGGKAPKTDGAFVGDVAEIPYVADYFFYRAENN